MKVHSSKTKRFWETSSKNRNWQHQKRSIFLQKWNIGNAAAASVPLRFAIFPSHLKYCACHSTSYEVLHLSRKIILANLEICCFNMKPLLSKSAPWSPDMSDADVCCTAPASEMPLCRYSSNAPCPPSVFKLFKLMQNPTGLANCCAGAESIAPATQNHIQTSKSGPRPSSFNTFDFEMCFAPQRCALFGKFNFQKYDFTILTSTRASHHNGSGPAALARLLFDPAEPQSIGKKTQCFLRLFYLFACFYLLSTGSLFSDSSHNCCCICPYVGSLTSKLPSAVYIIYIYIHTYINLYIHM